MKPSAYTVGNPEAYEPYLDAEPGPMKAKGGVVFLTLEDAQECVEDGYLPPEWVEGRVLPGRVYGLVCNVNEDVEKDEEGLFLNKPVLLVRL